MFLVLALLTICGIGLVTFFSRKFANALYYAGKLGGPKAYPLIGNGLLFLNKSPSEFFLIIQKLAREYGKCCRLWFGPDLVICVADARVAEEILSSSKYIEKSAEYNFFRPWLGNGLLTSSNKKWHSHRKVITPTFHFKILKQFVQTFDSQSDIFVEQLWARAKAGECIDIFPLVTLWALDVICESAMGTKINAQIHSDSEYVKAVKEITNIMHIRTYDVFARFDFLFNLSRLRKRQDKVLAILHDHTYSVIHSRRRELQDSKTSNTVDELANELGIRRKIAFLDMLLQATIDGQPLTDEEIREEVDTFMFEGHDTTTSAVSFLLYRLAKHPEVQQKVYDEVMGVIGDDISRPITLSMLNELHYLELVIKETLRLYPSVPILGRKLNENVEIDGSTFPAGANVIISPLFMGRDPDYFEDPLEFRPERFDRETSVEKQNPFQYIPFSAGPRNCIGQKFAMAELKSIASKVLRHFVILPPVREQEESFIMEMILRPTNGIMLRFEKRQLS